MKSWKIIYTSNGVKKHVSIKAISKIKALKSFILNQMSLVEILDISQD
jgi:hypothetical protein